MASPLAPAFLLVFAAFLAAAPSARAAPAIELFTVGPGDNLFSHFGHTALCVVDDESPDGRCYNFGTADVGEPAALAWATLRGGGRFWVGEVPRLLLLQAYQLEDRTIWRQRLPLPDEQAEQLAARLAQLVGEAGAYRYHPYFDNCTTRVRDLVDAAAQGKLRAGSELLDGETFRRHSEPGFAGRPLLLAAQLLALGAAGERPTTIWEAMFLPLVLRDQVALRLDAPPAVVYQRISPIFPASTAVGAGLLVVLGLLLAAALGILGRRPGPARRLALAGVGATLGAAGAGIWLLVFSAAFPEIRENAVVLLLVPLDLVIAFLPDRWLGTFAKLRLCGVGLVLSAALAGLVVQPVVAIALLPALPAATLWLVTRRDQPAVVPSPAPA